MRWTKEHCFVRQCPKSCLASGYDLNQDKDGIWYEGTSQAALAWLLLGKKSEYHCLMGCLHKAQSPCGGIYAACHDDGVSTGFSWRYYHRLHVAATCWYIFVNERYNPYWGQ